MPLLRNLQFLVIYGNVIYETIHFSASQLGGLISNLHSPNLPPNFLFGAGEPRSQDT